MSRPHLLQSILSPRKPVSHNGMMFDSQPTYNHNASPAAFNACSPTQPRKAAHTGPVHNVNDQLPRYPPGTPDTPTTHYVRPTEAHTGPRRHHNLQTTFQSPSSHHPSDFYSLPPPQTPSTPLKGTSVEYSSPFFHQPTHGTGLRAAATPTTPGHHMQPNTPTSSRRMPGLLQPCSLYSTPADPSVNYQSSSPAAHQVLTPHKTTSSTTNRDVNVFSFQTPTTAATAATGCQSRRQNADYMLANRLTESVPRSPATNIESPGNLFCRSGNLPHRIDEQCDATVKNNNNSSNVNNNNIQQQQQMHYNGYQEAALPVSYSDVRCCTWNSFAHKLCQQLSQGLTKNCLRFASALSVTGKCFFMTGCEMYIWLDKQCKWTKLIISK